MRLCQRVRLRALLTFMFTALLVLSACSPGSPDRQHGMKGPGGGRSGGGAAGSPTQLYSRALALKAGGHCDRAEGPLARLAGFGRGYEMAQFHFGDCLILRSERSGDTERGHLVSLGTVWLERAANSRDVDAQGRLVELYIEERFGQLDVIAAATWYLIFQANPARTQFALKEISANSKTRLFALATSEDWAEAKARQNAWSPVVQEAKVPSAGFAPDQAGRGSGSKRDGGRGGGGRRGGGGSKG